MSKHADLVQAFRKASEASGWTVAKQLDLVMTFIGSQNLESRFLRFLETIQADKRELTPGEVFAGKRGLLVKHEMETAGCSGFLTACGQLWVRGAGEYQRFPWFADSAASGKPWVPEKRKSFVSLFKQKIREGEFNRLGVHGGKIEK